MGWWLFRRSAEVLACRFGQLQRRGQYVRLAGVGQGHAGGALVWVLGLLGSALIVSSGCLPLLCVVVPGWCSRDVAALRASPCSRVRTACFGGTRSPAQHRGGLCRCWCDRLGGGRPPSGEAWAQHWTPSILWRLLTHHVFSWCSLQRGLGPHSGRGPLLCAWLHALLCSAPRHPLGCHATGAGRLCVCSGVAPVPVVCCR